MAVSTYIDLITHRVHNLFQSIKTGYGAVDLPACMIGDNNPIDSPVSSQFLVLKGGTLVQ